MSTPPFKIQERPASAAVRFFVPGYLLLIGLVLFAGSAYLFANFSDELFVAGLAFAGGLTMWLTVAALLTVGRRG